MPQHIISEDTDDGSPLTPREQNFSPPLPPKVPGKFYEEPKFDEKNRYILEILNDYTFLQHGAPDPARWLHDKFHESNIDGFYKTVSLFPEEKIVKWFEAFERKVHGDHIDEGDMFAAMHTRKGPTEGQLTWASPVSENFYGQYKQAAREKAILEGLISPNDDLGTRIPFQPDVWEATDITNSKSQGKRVKRGDKIYGFGGHGKQLLKLPSSSRSRSSLLCHPSSQTSSGPDPEKEQLREEVSNLKEMMQQVQEREKKTEEQLQQFMQQMMGGQLQPQQRLNPSVTSYFSPGGMYIPQQQQQQLQPFHQQFSGQTLPSPNGGTGGMLDLLLDSNFNFVGVGGSGGVGSRSGCNSGV